jgi:hypothetical protein
MINQGLCFCVVTLLVPVLAGRACGTGPGLTLVRDGTPAALTMYVRARLLWDAGQDVDALIREWCDRLYGAAAPALYGYFQALERTWCSTWTSRRTCVVERSIN